MQGQVPTGKMYRGPGPMSFHILAMGLRPGLNKVSPRSRSLYGLQELERSR